MKKVKIDKLRDYRLTDYLKSLNIFKIRPCYEKFIIYILLTFIYTIIVIYLYFIYRIKFKNNLYYEKRIQFLNNANITYNESNLITLQDKLNWLLIHDTSELKGKCSDKILLHEYSKKKIRKRYM